AGIDTARESPDESSGWFHISTSHNRGKSRHESSIRSARVSRMCRYPNAPPVVRRDGNDRSARSARLRRSTACVRSLKEYNWIEMGVLLTPIILKQELALDDLRGRRFAVDTNGELYQFLALIRLRDGSPLRDSHGRITSHLSGLFYRTTRLISDYRLQLVFVFDGKPPSLKSAEIERRRNIKARYDAEHAQAIEAGDQATAYSKATMTSRLTRGMTEEARHLLEIMGIPVVQAPSEGEAQASHMAAQSAVWAAASKDYDCLLFGAPRLLRFLTISGKEFLPSKGAFRAITPEVIETLRLLDHYKITREQLIDLAILVGTDFNDG